MSVKNFLCRTEYRRYIEAALLLTFFFTVSFFYYYDIFHTWFVSDDLAAIYHATGTIKEIFLENRYSTVFYTPLAILSLKPDLLLFGFNPFYYHIHNYLLLIFIAFMFYKVTSLYANRLNSLIAQHLFYSCCLRLEWSNGSS